MKGKLLLLLIGWFLAGNPALKAQNLESALTWHAQGENPGQYISLEESFSHLEDKFNATIMYRSEIVEEKKVEIEKLHGEYLHLILDQILRPFYLGYEQIGNRHFTILPLKLSQAEEIYQETITGRVTDGQNGEGLPGVNIVVKGTTQGTSTESDGSYEIVVPTLRDTLVFSYIGFQQKEEPIAERSEINVVLQSEAVAGDEVVVVGYGTQKRADLTGAVSTVDVERTLRARPLTDLGRGLQGAIPGLTITSPTGEIGSSPSINLRGMRGSLNTGSAGAQPLILVDNVEVSNLNMVNPNNIESISVLKDAASSAIYGTRGAWGVILINTKAGNFEVPPQLTYSNNFSISTPTSKIEVANAADGTEAALAAIKRLSLIHI